MYLVFYERVVDILNSSEMGKKYYTNTPSCFFCPQHLDFREFTIQMIINLFYSIQEDVNSIIY